MLIRKAYYLAKPVLPLSLRLYLRRWRGRILEKRYAESWPISESAATPPAGWQGWPGKRPFAVVLTHDVEGQIGLDRCRQVAELEMRHGFRSSFNFVPEGEYRVSKELRDFLTSNGFEVGVHGLHHDGKLYNSRAVFSHRAQQINRYLKEWGAVGFRSPFMHHNLDWLHDLDVEYDASTFDTDPFEPQPDSANTIFPFWVPPVRDRPGYMELPYTLTQDVTLFTILSEDSTEIWRKKVQWIVSKGGMVLLNTHPDYMLFGAGELRPVEFRVSHYEDFLKWLRSEYDGRFWEAIPREVARTFKSSLSNPPPPAATPMRAIAFERSPTSNDTNKRPTWECNRQAAPEEPSEMAMDPACEALKGKRVGVLLFSNYPDDPRPRRSAESMVALGMEVDLLCLADGDGCSREEQVHGVHVRRVPLRKSRKGKLAYFLEYGLFFLSGFWFLTRGTLKRRYDLVHVHNMPDFLVFAAIIPRLLGAKVILDLHDPMPELMTAIFGVPMTSPWIKVIRFVERISTGFAHAVITVNRRCHEIFSTRSCPARKVHVVMNTPDELKFPLLRAADTPQNSHSGPWILMYHGSLVERHGLDLAISAIQRLKGKHPRGIELRVYGSRTAYLDRVLESLDASMKSSVKFLGPKNLDELREAIDQCDMGIIPNRRSLFTEINTPTRIFEYLSRGKPVIAPDSDGITDYFTRETLPMFKLGDAADLERVIHEALTSPDQMREIAGRGQKVYLEHRWSQERLRLVELLLDLLSPDLERGSAAERVVKSRPNLAI